LLAGVGCIVFPAFGVVNVVYGRRVSPLLARAQQLRAEVSGVAHESFDGALVVKALGREVEETQRFAARAGDLRDSMIRAGRVRGTFDPVMEALPNLGVLAVLLVGAARIESGALVVGDLVQVAYLFTLLAFPIRSIGWVFGELPRAVVGFSRVGAVLSARGEQRFGSAVVGGSGPATVSVRDVTFRYGEASSDTLPSDTPQVDSSDASDRPALVDVSFDIAAGKVVAVTGRTGSGKSTLVNLLVRLVDPDQGTVSIDGVNLAEAARGEVSGAVALVAQHAFLFDDTVRANVTLGADRDDGEVWDALARAQADRFVNALPDGLDTRVGERGTSLSGGQRQRIALARALIRIPRLLVLDDATSSVDPTVEASILASLRDATDSSTVVVVAHRRATIALADEVVLLDAGRVVARGRHQDLLESSPGYAALLSAYERAAREREATAAAALAAQPAPEPAPASAPQPAPAPAFPDLAADLADSGGQPAGGSVTNGQDHAPEAERQGAGR
jgi:ABC-type multidrug transport system fused ATPase/permease subunit